MLVDTGSSTDILYLSTFDKLQLPRNLLQPLHTLLIGFTSHSINVMGMVTLDFIVGAGIKVSTIRAQFTVVDIAGGIGEVCEDHKRSRIGYQTYMPPLNKRPSEEHRKRSTKNHMKINTVKNEGQEDNSPKEMESEKRAMLHEEVLIVPFKQENKDKTFIICTKLGKERQQWLIALVRDFEDVFAWGPEDMAGIDPAVAIARNMDIYVDDMLVKSKTRADHLENLGETFDQLRESRLKVNPEK
ncbi:hypothetical protein LIER_14867 [Lithospermum erythrorhizon]|uniref:Reverse transcriptase domain-containing protein n=1 Tax=Lithospermum erythrorhizon TaxID=34254 RepID=A0AAV3Q4S8_LITER